MNSRHLLTRIEELEEHCFGAPVRRTSTIAQNDQRGRRVTRTRAKTTPTEPDADEPAAKLAKKTAKRGARRKVAK